MTLLTYWAVVLQARIVWDLENCLKRFNNYLERKIVPGVHPAIRGNQQAVQKEVDVSSYQRAFSMSMDSLLSKIV